MDRSARQPGEFGGCDVEVVRGVDVDSLDGIHHEQLDLAAETIVITLVDLGPGQVQRPGLPVTQLVRGHVLASGAVLVRVVCDDPRLLLPDEDRFGDHTDHGVGARGRELLQGASHGGGQAQRGGRLQQHHLVRASSLLDEDVDGVLDDGFSGCGVLGQCIRTLDHSSTRLAGDRCDLGILGGHVDVQARCGQGLGHRTSFRNRYDVLWYGKWRIK